MLGGPPLDKDRLTSDNGVMGIHFRKELCECQNTKQVREQDKQIFVIIIVPQVTANLLLQSKNHVLEEF